MLWLLALAGISLLVWVVLHIAKSLSEEQRAFSELCDAVGARPSGPVATGFCDGTEYRLAYAFETRSHVRPSPTFLIALVGRSRQRFRVVRRDRENLVSKLARGTSTVETGDADLDRTVHITARPPEAWAGYFAGGERQYAIRKLLELGVGSVALDGGLLEAKWMDANLRDDIDADAVTAAIGYLRLLASGLTGFFETGAAPFGASAAKLQRLLLLGVPTLLMALGIGSFLLGILRFPPLDFEESLATSAPYVAAVFALLLAIGAWLWGDIPATRREIWVAASGAGLGAAVSTVGFVLLLNGTGFRGTAALHTALVTHKIAVRGPLYSPRIARVRSWRHAHDDEWIWVSRDLYRHIIPGKTRLIVTVRPGRLGFQWVEHVTEVR